MNKKAKWFLLLLPVVLALIYFLTHLSFIKVISKSDNGCMHLAVHFIIPVSLDKTNSKVTSEHSPLKQPYYEFNQKNNQQVDIYIQEKIPYGNILEVSINYRPFNLPISLSIKKQVVNNVAPKLLSSRTKIVPSHKPVEFNFNTFINPESLLKNTKASIPGSFSAAADASSGSSDYSRWLFKPNLKLSENQQFTVTFYKNIKSRQGKRLNRSITCVIKAAPKLKMLYCSIKNGGSNVHLYPTIKFQYNQSIKKASVILKDLKTGKMSPGKIQLKDKTVIYTPYNALLPGTKYKITITAAAATGEKSRPIDNCFTTITMKNKYWMDVKLGNIHTVTVYKDRYPVRVMIASGGRSGHETPVGTYYVSNRGSSFWSPRFGEGATYWVRIVGDILIHSIPKDKSWTTKKEEHAKLGLPASHGCIRLAEPDAKWVYDNIPSQTMIIIHE